MAPKRRRGTSDDPPADEGTLEVVVPPVRAARPIAEAKPPEASPAAPPPKPRRRLLGRERRPVSDSPVSTPSAPELLRRAWQGYQSTFAAAWFVAAVPTVAYAAVTVLLVQFHVLPNGLDLVGALPYLLLIGAATLAYLMALALAWATIARLGRNWLEEGSLDPFLAWQTARSRAGAVLYTTSRAVAVVLGGLLLLVVPGLLLFGNYFVEVPVALYEWRSGREALVRSRELMAGRRGSAVLAFLLLAVPWGILLALFELARPPVFVEAVGMTLLVSLPLPLLAFLPVVVYQDAHGLPWPARRQATIGSASNAAAEPQSSTSTPAGGARTVESATPSAVPSEGLPPSQRDGPSHTALYTCPRCLRTYRLPYAPPAGTLCPSCRRAENPARPSA